MDTSNAPKYRIITLTDHPPVRIREDHWPVIAADRWWDGLVECQASRSGWLKVRQHADGRTIVYGGYSSAWQGERDRRRGGALLPPGSNLVPAIRAVAEEIHAEEIVASVIADLPVVEI